jgi:hypothetical protein
MINTKLDALLERKKKLDDEIKHMMEKRYNEIGKILKDTDLLNWDNKSLKKAFKFINEQGEKEFLK